MQIASTEERLICNSPWKHLCRRDPENKVFPFCTIFGGTDPFLVCINIPPTIFGAQPLRDLMTISIKNIMSTLLNTEFIKEPSDTMVRPKEITAHTRASLEASG